MSRMTEQERIEYEEQIKEYFARGGTVTKCAIGETSADGANLSVWKKSPGRPKKTAKKSKK